MLPLGANMRELGAWDLEGKWTKYTSVPVEVIVLINRKPYQRTSCYGD